MDEIPFEEQMAETGNKSTEINTTKGELTGIRSKELDYSKLLNLSQL